MGAEVQVAHLRFGADVVGQSPGGGNGDGTVAAADDGGQAGGEDLAHCLVDAFAAECRIDLRHLHVAAVDTAAFEIDLELEPVGKVLLGGEAELSRALFGAGLADVALVEGHSEECVAGAGVAELLGVECDVLRAQEGDLSRGAVVVGLVASPGRKEMRVGFGGVHSVVSLLVYRRSRAQGESP